MNNPYHHYDHACALRFAEWRATRATTTALWLGFLALCAGALLVIGTFFL